MKEYNCPDCCMDSLSCADCVRVKQSKQRVIQWPTISPAERWPYVMTNKDKLYVPKACLSCSNHPTNGGTGVCFCTAGLINSVY